MVRRKEEIKSDYITNKFGGDGYIAVENLNFSDTELNNKGRVFAHTVLPAGSSIGYHEHHGESEIYFILKGEGEFNDNGEISLIHEGDVTYTFAGMGHGIKNTGKDSMEIIALILYA